MANNPWDIIYSICHNLDILVMIDMGYDMGYESTNWVYQGLLAMSHDLGI